MTAFATSSLTRRGDEVAPPDTTTTNPKGTIMRYRNRKTGVIVNVRDDKVLPSDFELVKGAKAAAAAPAESEVYDPTAHSAAEVAAYLADADDVERARVLEVEAASKRPRKSVTEWQPPTDDES